MTLIQDETCFKTSMACRSFIFKQKGQLETLDMQDSMTIEEKTLHMNSHVCNLLRVKRARKTTQKQPLYSKNYGTYNNSLIVKILYTKFRPPM